MRRSIKAHRSGLRLGTKTHCNDCFPVMSVQEGHPAAADENAPQPPRAAPRTGRGLSRSTLKIIKRLGLTYITTEALTMRRQRHGRGFRYVRADGSPVNAEAVKRLAALAMPPAYNDVLYASDPRAHIQAIGRDAAGRLQYRYHPDWRRVRETRKARRLARLAEALPQIRRSIGRHLSTTAPTRAFALSAIIELVARSAIRPGTERYARLRGTRGAATLLKSNVSVYGETVRLCFRAKGGKRIEKEVHAPKLVAAVAVLRQLPGRRLFQYRSEDGTFRQINAHDVNCFLREIAGVEISLKDFRTLLASVTVLDALARAAPATGKRARRRQVLDAIRQAANELGNTPAICGKSYVHETVVNAFEDGVLEQFADALRGCRSTSRSEKVLAQVAAQIVPDVAA
jgi:DNA topoisomerase I